VKGDEATAAQGAAAAAAVPVVASKRAATAAARLPVIAPSGAPPRVAIIGGGAMGSLFAAKLAAEADVRVFTSWAEHAAAATADGLLLHAIGGGSPAVARVAIMSPAAYGRGGAGGAVEADAWRADVVLVLVKGGQTAPAALLAADVVSADGVVVTLQNGIGPMETLRGVLGERRVLFGSTAQAATMLGPGSVLHAGDGPTTIVAPIEALAPAARDVAMLLDATGLPAKVAPASEMAAVCVHKLTVNACINPLTALFGITNGEVAEAGKPRALLSRLHGEVQAAAEGLSKPLRRALGRDVELPASSAAFGALVPDLGFVLDVARRTRHNTSSMLADVKRGASTEIDFINGVVVEAAAAVGAAVPVNQSVISLVKAQASCSV